MNDGEGRLDIPGALQGDTGHFGQMMAALPPSKRRDLGKISHLKTIKAGEVVVDDDQLLDHLGFVLEGTLAITKLLPDGRVHIIGLLVPTDMYGRVFEGVSSCRIEALSDTQIYCFDREPFEQIFLETPEIERLFLVNVLDELDAAREWVLLLGGHRVIERVASFLLILSRRKTRQLNTAEIMHNQPFRIQVKIKRIDLARYLGTRPETLSRAFHELEDRKALRIIDPYNFEIRDLNVLTDIAGHDLILRDGKAQR